MMAMSYAETILNSLSAHIAIIDENGVIMETNRAWRQFARSNRVDMRPDMLNINYLEICDVANKDAETGAGSVARGIRRVIRGEIGEFAMDYPCHSPDEKRWFYMRAIRFAGEGPLRVVISHENITSLKLAEEKIRRREEELALKTVRLEEANAALRALIRQREDDMSEMEARVFRNLEQGVFPYLDQLRQMARTGADERVIELMSTELKQIASPFLKQVASLETVLTPQELRVAQMIRQGLSSKEIADVLGLSMTTINFHRRNLREKLGLRNTATNLNAYLRTLAVESGLR